MTPQIDNRKDRFVLQEARQLNAWAWVLGLASCTAHRFDPATVAG